jgi:hypothetical protein
VQQNDTHFVFDKRIFMSVKKLTKGQRRNKTVKAKFSNGATSPFESPWFWLYLATIDFGKFPRSGAKENK